MDINLLESGFTVVGQDADTKHNMAAFTRYRKAEGTSAQDLSAATPENAGQGIATPETIWQT